MRGAGLVLAFLLALPVASPAMASATATSEVPLPAEAQKLADQFLSQLKAGKAEQAVDGVMASSALWSNRTGVKEQMMAQIDAANKIYGPVSAYEKVSTEWVGTMLVRQYYLVQHKEMLTRWELDFTRTSEGWKIGYFGFTDDIRSWF